MFSKKYALHFVFLFSCNALFGMDVETGNTELFEKIKHLLTSASKGLPKISTGISLRRHVEYNGLLTSIIDYPRIYGTGFIIENAQPSMFCGLWYDATRKPEDLIVVAEEFEGDFEVLYQARIKPRTESPATLKSCCLFDEKNTEYQGLYKTKPNNNMNCHLAILWDAAHREGSNENAAIKSYITMARLAEIEKQGNIFDLDNGKIELK